MLAVFLVVRLKCGRPRASVTAAAAPAVTCRPGQLASPRHAAGPLAAPLLPIPRLVPFPRPFGGGRQQTARRGERADCDRGGGRGGRDRFGGGGGDAGHARRDDRGGGDGPRAALLAKEEGGSGGVDDGEEGLELRPKRGAAVAAAELSRTAVAARESTTALLG